MRNILPFRPEIDSCIAKKSPGLKPLHGQLLKWIGNKQRFASEIISFFPEKYHRYFEPFLGSGAVLAALAPETGIGSDIFPPLIEIWNTLKNHPDTLIEWYTERYRRMEQNDKAAVYEQIKESFNRNPNGADFLFLSRSCYGGVIRFRKTDRYMSTPCGIHNPISPKAFSSRVFEWNQRVKGSSFFAADYIEIMDKARAGDFIYCDPPYTHSQGIVYGAQDFQLEKLLGKIEECKQKGAKIALSIDGTKKSGILLCDLPIPQGLFKAEAFIQVGRSMLRRFQMNGRTLEAEKVKDRLLLTY